VGRNGFWKSARTPKSPILMVCRPTARPCSLVSSDGAQPIQPGFSARSARNSEIIGIYSIHSGITWLEGSHCDESQWDVKLAVYVF